MSKAQRYSLVKELAQNLRTLHQKGDVVIEIITENKRKRSVTRAFVRNFINQIQVLDSPVERFDAWKNLIDAHRRLIACNQH